MRTFLLLSLAALTLAAQNKDISGTWVAKSTNPMMGDVEFVFELKVDANGKITGTQRAPFGDSPIVDGHVDGDKVEFTVQTESFGNISKTTTTGTIVGDELHITPAMGGGRGRGRGGPDGAPAPNGRAGRGGFGPQPLIAKRGTPTPTYRSPSIKYATLPKIELPAPRELPSNGLARTPPMGWNSWNKFRPESMTKRFARSPMPSCRRA